MGGVKPFDQLVVGYAYRMCAPFGSLDQRNDGRGWHSHTHPSRSPVSKPSLRASGALQNEPTSSFTMPIRGSGVNWALMMRHPLWS